MRFVYLRCCNTNAAARSRKERFRKLNVSIGAAAFACDGRVAKEANLTHRMIVLALGVAMASAASTALAADLAAPPPPPPPEVAVAPNPFAPVGAIVALPVTVATAVVNTLGPPPPPPVVASY